MSAYIYPLDAQPHPFTLTALDRRLILLTQTGLPLTPRPYQTLAGKLNITEDEVIARMQRLLDNDCIRRIAAVPNHYRLGYTFNGMSVWDVDDQVATELGQRVGALDFVSHCYLRPRHLPHWPYNLFAMVHCHSKEEIEPHIETIQRCLDDHCRGHEVLLSKRILKKTGLRFDQRFAGA